MPTEVGTVPLRERENRRERSSGRDILTPMMDKTSDGPMSPGMLQMKLLLLANRIELEILMFETDTAANVSSITLTRRPDGGADVSVNLSPR
jgi:hypothetical protein